MTPHQKELVRKTWAGVAPASDAAAELFYARLFEIDPSTSSLFAGSDMKEQRRKLMAAIASVVNGIDNIEGLVPALAELGKRHASYGVTDAHYATVGSALLDTLEKGLAEAWTPEVRTAWTDAYGLVSGVMRKAMAEAAVSTRA